MSENIDVLVIGGGAAGMMAAGKVGEKGAKVILLEKNSALGKKILITGKGRCNVTNNKDIEEFINNFPGNGKFLYSAFYSFSNYNVMDFFEKLGVKLKVERGDRVFPVSDKSRDIVGALEKYLNQNNVKIYTNSKVQDILIKEDNTKDVILENGKIINAKNVIIATGGASYPLTGSTGDGYGFAKKMGHSIKTIRPSLIPLVTEEEWVKELQGLSLKNISILIKNAKGKKIASDFGEMIFTHFGVSGPLVLTVSRKVVDYWQKNTEPLKLFIDLKPALNPEKFDARLQRDIEKYSNKQIKNSLGDLLPQKIIPIIIQLAQLDETKKMHQITREERKALNDIIKNFPLTLVKARPLTEAIVTKGGINVKEIDPHTMESKIVKGIYFVGEVLDIDGYTGGYNLQAAFSTGFLAADSIEV